MKSKMNKLLLIVFVVFVMITGIGIFTGMKDSAYKNKIRHNKLDIGYLGWETEGSGTIRGTTGRSLSVGCFQVSDL